MESTVETIEDGKVRVRVAVPAPEFDRALDEAFRKLAREVRVPGFRPGKAPRRLLEAQFGTGAAREQALRDALPEYYVRAVTEHDVDVIDVPDIEITAGQEAGDVEFEAVVAIRPTVRLSGYEALRIEVPRPAVTDDMVEAQVDRYREQFADLTDTEDPLVDGTFATIDVRGRQDGAEIEGLVATDFLYEVGSELLVPELDAELRGTRPGAILSFSAELPERFGERAGETVEFSVIVKAVQRRVLPEVTDAWVDEHTEYDTAEELRSDVRRRMEVAVHGQVRSLVAERVLDAVADRVPIEPPAPLVEQETRRRIEELAGRLGQQGVGFEQYFAATGKDQEEFLEEVRAGASRAVLADLALRAVAAQESLEVPDAEVDEQLQRFVEQSGRPAAEVRADLDRSGGREAVRSELVRQKALEYLVGQAVVVDEDGDEIDLAAIDETPETPETPRADEDRDGGAAPHREPSPGELAETDAER